jgi:hypothetical protein
MRLAKKPRMVLRHSSPYAVDVLQSRGMLVLSLRISRTAKDKLRSVHRLGNRIRGRGLSVFSRSTAVQSTAAATAAGNYSWHSQLLSSVGSRLLLFREGSRCSGLGAGL